MCEKCESQNATHADGKKETEKYYNGAPTVVVWGWTWPNVKKKHSLQNADYILSNGLWHVRRHFGNETRKKKLRRTLHADGAVDEISVRACHYSRFFFSPVLSFSVFLLVDRDTMTLKLEYLKWERR